MRPHHDTPSTAPDLEIRGACFACGGDLSIRLGERAARCVCRRCGTFGEARIEREPDGLQVSQVAVAWA